VKRSVLAIGLVLLVGVAAVSTVLHRVDVRDETEEGTIISLAPNVTEILFALGLQDRLVAVSTACDYPPEAKTLPKAGDMGVPDIELLYALKPELAIGTELRDAEAAEAIERCGSRFVAVKQGTVAEVLASIEQIGEAAGVGDRAQKYVAGLRKRIALATVEVPADRRPRVYVELQPAPLATAAKGTFLDELISLAGGTNIAHDFPKAWTTISPDEVVARNPQIIVITHRPEGGGEREVATRIGWSGIDAVRAGRVVTTLDADLFLRPGPRLVDGLEALARLFASWRKETAR